MQGAILLLVDTRPIREKRAKIDGSKSFLSLCSRELENSIDSERVSEIDLQVLQIFVIPSISCQK